MKAYAICFDHSVVPRKTMLDFLDSQKEIRNWRATVGSVFIATDLDPTAVAKLIMDRFPGTHFIVIEVHYGTIQGWADSDTWEFLNRPKPWPGK